MGLHHELDIFRTAYELLVMTTELTRQTRRDAKPILVELLLKPCLEITVSIQNTNIAEDKAPHIALLLNHLGRVEVMLRVAHEKRYIATSHFGKAIALSTSVGKQANGWKKSQLPPVA